MSFSFDGNGKGFKVVISGNWRQVMAFLRAVATVIAVMLAVRLLPQLAELVTLLGL